MSDRILCVDDDPNILAGYQRILHARFALDTARGAQEALKKMQTQGPYAVVVSDLRMPEMDGITLLTKVRELSPDTVRIVLTGYADIQMAMAAVNEGSVFRFLAKPCPPEHLAKALQAALQQYRLQRVERELLELTLRGVTRPVRIDVRELGHGTDPWGAFRRGFEGTTKLVLKDFGIEYDLGPMAREVELFLTIEGVRQTEVWR